MKQAPRRGPLTPAHRCRECGKLSSNRIAADDSELLLLLLLQLAVTPLAAPPFPLRGVIGG